MEIKILKSILEFPKLAWQKLEPENFPFASYEFLAALERSHSLGQRTGWFPYFVAVYEKSELVGVGYFYVKSNSYGEYIFDWSWADFWRRNGLAYYPKIVGAVPFTPASGLKVLCAKNISQELIYGEVLQKIKQMVESREVSTAHLLFAAKEELELFQTQGFTIRKTYQFHWYNDGYNSFEDYLMALQQKRRHDIRRERKLLEKENLQIVRLTGEEVQQYPEVFYQLYLTTIDKKNSPDYLTQEFFKEIFLKMSDKILLFIAFRGEEIIAGTLNFYQGDKLFGRYWGSFAEVPFLHFELCYYRPIEFAIERKLKLFEAGAQGEHKLARGFVPSYTYSAHYFPINALSERVKKAIEAESLQVEQIIAEGKLQAYK